MKKVYSKLMLVETTAMQIETTLQRFDEENASELTWQQIRERFTSHDLARAVKYFLEKEKQEKREREANTIVIEEAEFQLIN